MENLSLDNIYNIIQKLNVFELIRFTQVNKLIYNNKKRWIGGLIRNFWYLLYKDDLLFKETNSYNYNFIDLYRLESRIISPMGNCISCLRNIPLRLGNFCIECVGNPNNFIYGNSHLHHMLKCSNNHSDICFTCLICEMSICYNCLFLGNGCNFCHLISEEL